MTVCPMIFSARNFTIVRWKIFNSIVIHPICYRDEISDEARNVTFDQS